MGPVASGPESALGYVPPKQAMLNLVTLLCIVAAAAAAEGISNVGSAVGTGLSAAAEGSAVALDVVLSAGGAIAEGLGDVLGSIDF